MKRLSYISIVAILWLSSCADLDVENELAPDAQRALANPSDLVSLIGGAAGDVFYDQMALSNNHYDLQSDLLTTTNNAYGFWHVCDQPRREIVNNTGYSEYATYIQPSWDLNITAITNVTSVIKAVRDNGVILTNDDGENVTSEVLAMGYLVRGIAHGAIAMVYDRGYAINENTDLTSLELVDYNIVMDEAIASLEAALSVLDTGDVSQVEFYPQAGITFTPEEFRKLVNSYAARLLIGVARNPAEAANLDYARIKGYAEKGITSDFIITTDGSAVVAEGIAFMGFVVGGGDPPAEYIPVDQMISWLLDPVNQPVDYPTTGILPKAESSDARLDMYYYYTTDFGFLNASRNRPMFSNLNYQRYPDLVDVGTYAGTTVPFMLTSEMSYIIAECEWKLGNNDVALGLINNGPRSTVGGLTDATDNSDASIKKLLFYENSIEIAHHGKAIHWGFMRRHNLLQTGTPLHWAVPARELEIQVEPLYTYGSPSRADGVNTSDGSGSWNGN